MRLVLRVARWGSSHASCGPFSDNEAADLCGFVVFFPPCVLYYLSPFLVARALRVPPVPGDPGEVAALEGPDAGVDEDEIAVRHCAEVEERVPGHCGVSREASMARRAASCSANWRRGSRGKREVRIRGAHISEP